MLLDVLSPSNNCTFNIKVANYVGLEAAVYLAELATINEKAVRHNKNGENCLIDGKYFKITNRDYLTTRTTLSAAKQKKIEEKLVSCKILEKHPEESDTFYFDADLLVSMIGGEIKDVTKKIKALTKTQTKEDKQEGMIRKLMSVCIATKTSDIEFKTAWFNWMKAVCDRGKCLNTSTVEKAWQTVNNFAQGDLDIALELLSYSTCHGYPDMQWAVKNYTSYHTLNSTFVEPSARNITFTGEVY